MQPIFNKKQLKSGRVQLVEFSKMALEKEKEIMEKNFADNLKKIRKEHHLSQEQLAEELGVSRQAISKWESSLAYPEMDKIIFLCDKFNLNIDDLLHKDIKEVKGEEDTKKRLNHYIDSFLAFITDTINLFSSMTLKSKLKCLFEEVIIAIILLIASNLFVGILMSLFTNIFSFIPSNILFIIERIIRSVLSIICIILGIIIMTHIFKTRYLDYYINFKDKNSNEDTNKDKTKDVHQEINIHEDKKKIIIRDPKNSEYKLVHGLWKVIVLIFKLLLLWPLFLLCIMLVGLFVSFVLSFLVYKTGIFFIGLLLTILSSSVIVIIFLLLIFNFIWNRKNNKKKMINGFIISLVLFGIGCGLISTGVLQFDVMNPNETMLKSDSLEVDMNDKFFITNRSDIEYIIDNRDNVKITYQINKLCHINSSHYENNQVGIYLYTYCNEPTKLVREFIKGVNQKKIIPIDDMVSDIKVYASEENINKMKNNKEEYYNNQKSIEERYQSYEDDIHDLTSKIYTYEEKINELERKLDEYEERD